MTARTKKARRTTAPADPYRDSVTAFLATLEGHADRLALQLIAGYGVFHVEQAGAAIAGFVERLIGDDVAIDDDVRIVEASDQLEGNAAFVAYEEAMTGHVNNVRDAAYLLGIAVGRRLGRALDAAGGGQ